MRARLSIYDEPKIDCHNHVFDPRRFPYSPTALYAPTGGDLGTAAQLFEVFGAYGVRHALVVQPNSGYDLDNRCLLDALGQAAGRFRGMAIVPVDVSRSDLERLRSVGVLGVTFNVPVVGPDYFADPAGLFAELADLDMFIDVQVEGDQLVALAPLLERAEVRVLIDHCGRPIPQAGLGQAGFSALLRLADTRRALIKLSGFAKFSAQPYPYRDVWPYVELLTGTFGFDACIWGSDWPFLRAPERIDYGPLLKLVERLVPEPENREKVLWATAKRVFGF